MYPPSHRPFVRGQRVGAESGYCAIHGRKRLRADLEMLDANTGSLRCVSHKQCRPREAEEVVVCQLHHRPRNIHHMRMVAPQVYECLPQYICRPTRQYGNRTPHLAKAFTAEQPVTTFSSTSTNRPESASNDRSYRAQNGRVNYITPQNTTWMKRSAPTHSFSQNKSFVSSSATRSMMSATPFADELRAQSELHYEQSKWESQYSVNKEQGSERERRMNGNNSNWHSREQGQLMVGNTKYDTGEWSAPINTFTSSPGSYPINNYDRIAFNDDNSQNNINNSYEGNSLQFHSRYHSRRGVNESREFYYPSERMVWCAYHGKQIALSQSTRLRESCYVCVDSNTCLTSPLNTTQALYAMHCDEIMCELHGVLRSPAFMELNASQTGYQCTRMHRCREAAVAMSTHTLTTNKRTSNAISNGEGEGYHLQSERARDSSGRNSYTMNDVNNNNIDDTNDKDSDNDDNVNDLAYYQDNKASRRRLARSDHMLNEFDKNVDTSLSNTISSFLV